MPLRDKRGMPESVRQERTDRPAPNRQPPVRAQYLPSRGVPGAFFPSCVVTARVQNGGPLYKSNERSAKSCGTGSKNRVRWIVPWGACTPATAFLLSSIGPGDPAAHKNNKTAPCNYDPKNFANLSGSTGWNRSGPAKNAGIANVHLRRFRSGSPISSCSQKIFSAAMAFILLTAPEVEGKGWLGHKILYLTGVLNYILCDISKYCLTCNCDSLIQNCERLGANASWINIQYEAG